MPDILKKIYSQDTYFKRYGSSVYSCIIYIFILIYIIIFCSVWKTKTSVQDDWVNQRCSPYVFPFAGFINAPTNDSIISYTLKNFTECVQNEVQATTNIGTQPLNMITSGLTSIYLAISEGVLRIATFIAYLREQLNGYYYEIFQMLLNYIIPFQQINLSVVDLLKRTTAMLYTIIMTFVTVVGVIKDAFGSTIQIILNAYGILIVLFIVLLFFTPWSLVVAIPLSIVILTLLCLIIILLIFYAQIFDGLPSFIPSFPGFCFGKNTILVLKNKKKVKIQNIKLGSILEDGSVVKAKIKLSSDNIPMYNLNGVIVSDTHYVSLTPNEIHEKNKWIQVKNHSSSKEVLYSKSYLYCLSTSSKKIKINNMYFLDWDDMTIPFYHLFKDKKKMAKLLKGYSKYKKVDYDLYQQNMSQVKINDEIKDAKIIGKVKILKKKNIKYNIITNTEYFYSNKIKHQDFYDLINNL